jgi:hypothetical protein
MSEDAPGRDKDSRQSTRVLPLGKLHPNDAYCHRQKDAPKDEQQYA